MSASTEKNTTAQTTLVESRSIDWVPHEERHGKLWHQLPLWFLGNFQYSSVVIGFIGPSMGLSLAWTAVAGALGIIIGTLFMVFHASQGPQMGLPQMIQSRGQFGYRGVVIPLFATFVTYFMFNAVNQVLLGSGFKASFGLNSEVVKVVVAASAGLLAILGHDWVHRMFRIVLAISLPLTLIMTIGIVLGHGGGSAHGHPGGFTIVAFMAQLSAAAAYNITYAPYVSDYSRYLPADTKPSSVFASVFLGATVSAIWLIVLGAWMAVRLGATDGLAGMQTAGNNVFSHLGGAAALFSALALWATMGMNAYGGSLTVLTALASFRPFTPGRRSRIITVVALTLAWYAVGESISAGAVDAVFVSLTIMLYLLVPWTATNLVDYFVVRRGHYAIPEIFNPNGIYGSWAWRGIAAYALGLLAEVPFMVIKGLGPITYVGPAAGALGSVDIAWLVGLIVAGGSYWLFARSLDVSAEVSVASMTRA
ncbi:purine-cytosine permease family protein [Tsukamurella soli]|uniref:Cytosine permease n=1 Tax=Tsukamurella soli TaxID=644556 RepID=A0ABP8K7T1_9ACTN